MRKLSLKVDDLRVDSFETFEADCYPAKPGGGGGEYSLDLPCCV